MIAKQFWRLTHPVQITRQDNFRKLLFQFLTMLTTVKGVYENGQVIFSEVPPVSERTEVIITFLTEKKGEEPKKRVLGLLEGKIIVPDDFDEPLAELKEYM